jgi:F-type H+-transporting ATPase subunit gamma
VKRHALERRLAAIETLKEAISAMKNLSAHHFREMRAAVPPAVEYRRGVEEVAERVRASLPAGTGPAGILLVGGELGLCGPYNAQLVRALSERRERLPSGPTYCVGKRAARIAVRQGFELKRSYSAPSSGGGIPKLLLQLTRDLLGDYQKLNLSRLEVVSSAFEGVGAVRPRVSVLLPLSFEGPSEERLTPYLPAELLSAVAAREMLYCTMYDLLIEAFAAENGARLLATQAAEQWLDRSATGLRSGIAAAAREASTQEVIEISGGVRARHRSS